MPTKQTNKHQNKHKGEKKTVVAKPVYGRKATLKKNKRECKVTCALLVF